jgi:hypothetical protein
MKVGPLTSHVPGYGWKAQTTDGQTFHLWSPRLGAQMWSAGYTADDGWISVHSRKNTAEAACQEAYRRCPDRDLADEAARRLIEMAQQWWTENGT